MRQRRVMGAPARPCPPPAPLAPCRPPSHRALTPCPSALVKPLPIFPDVLKNWWVKCWAKKANIRLVPRGSASNLCRSRNLSARSWASGSCRFPAEDGGDAGAPAGASGAVGAQAQALGCGGAAAGTDPVLLCKPSRVHRLVVPVLRRARTFGPHGRGAVVWHGWENAGVVADVGVGLPADVAVVGVKGGGAGDEVGTNWKERAVSAAGQHPDPQEPGGGGQRARPRPAVLCPPPKPSLLGAAVPCRSRGVVLLHEVDSCMTN